MASENAKAVAEEVIRTICNNKLVNIQKISEENGYSHKSARCQIAKRTKTYKRIMESFEERLKKEIARIQTAMEAKDLDKEQYRILVEALDKNYKNYQLATGGATENQTINISLDNALANRYEVDINKNEADTSTNNNCQ